MIESVRTPEPRFQGQVICLLRHSDEFFTRSNVNQQRVSHSFCRAPRSFQIRSPTSLTLVPTSFALVPDSQLTVAIDRKQATTVLGEHHNKEQRKRTHQRSATMFAVFLLCVLRDTFVLDTCDGLCAHGCSSCMSCYVCTHAVNDD